MSLEPPLKVRKLQEALHAKAKGSPSYRFYLLYDKLYREDILAFAYRVCAANGGAAGVDGQDFEDIESQGREKWLGELAEELREKRYRPQAIRRVYIPKPSGGQRPLGIPTVRDRVVQTAVARRISDRQLLSLIRQWLQAPVEEHDGRGRKRRTTRAKDTGRGVPQGAPLSPLLSNLYMRRFVLGWEVLGHARRLGARIVAYADDFVICCRGTADEAMRVMRAMMERLKLTVNETKTRRCRLPEDSFDFLGYTIGRCWSAKTGRAYLGTRPSRTSIQRLCREISERTDRRTLLLDPEVQVARLNRMLVGWANYFYLGPVSPAYRSVDNHARARLRQWLRRKHKLKSRGVARFPYSYLYGKLGLVRLAERTRNLPWAKA
jgi:RNA-directed DNA polymerase